ncbi:MAG: phenylacetic acid degradation operon negative regulatory protein PaaX [Polaromonas sp.]
MNPFSQKRLDDFRQKSHIKAGSLIMSVFGDVVLPRGGRIWLGSLIKLLEPLLINERLVRTSVFRLAKEEWLRTEQRGRRTDYLLTPTGLRRFEEASRHIYTSNHLDWDRRWRLIFTVGELAPKERERVRRALFWQGFGVLGSDCFVHPNADLTDTFDALMTDGMSDLLVKLMPMLAAEVASGLTADHIALVNKAWNLEQLASAYGIFVDCYQPILEELRLDSHSETDDESAFLIRILLIHDYRRLLLRDPELPDVLLPAQWSGKKARQLCKELYRRLLAPSERHLDNLLQLANGTTPQPTPMLNARFQNEDPLAYIHA